MVLHLHGNHLESVMPSAFYIDPWQSWVSSMATFLTLEPQTSSRATGPTQDTPHKKLFSSVFGKKHDPHDQSNYGLLNHGFCFGVT